MRRFVTAFAAAGVVLLAGCSSDDGSDSGTVTLDVSAAASLKKAFTAIAAEFEKQHDGVTVRLSFDGSSTLANQIQQGAPADVFASADEKNMAKLGDLAVEPTIFATNTLVIVTAPGNPLRIRSFADLARPGVTAVVCQAAQPCGAATGTAERNTGITIDAASEEQSVSAVLTKVTTGQADAGVVYVTDARAAGDQVATVTDPAFAEVVNAYPVAGVRGADDGGLGKQFVDLVLGEDGQRILRDAGFGAP
ncbi:molybdate ABC transporter substrate-binding protein [Gordonia amicalis]|uniref:molybdate ABC transporter substrate-binding protein n=1 Tax=Gordonia amicalis TaxID=89053 RepID=UPI0002A621D8|nr:molybdate ABC transporter substrate-binding protein [Gordonia amicalis]MBA5848095.1 molybdate ABC transporter substrate-binding protein [Gordonia amicalis]MDV7100766.1 molybdate ABC transporter substrate-binding protein [Gordonia amicalis]MDV7172590.1 molybdate ABC transporter substrate-binding protein [Gordonia amicalis]NKX76177.1 molybdate ABC transporter substrate-binding protein [Gordonia amicalis]UKO92208.1 molybdate ABC transporter substrate-binding protein [Gordonia amicalis]